MYFFPFLSYLFIIDSQHTVRLYDWEVTGSRVVVEIYFVNFYKYTSVLKKNLYARGIWVCQSTELLTPGFC